MPEIPNDAVNVVGRESHLGGLKLSFGFQRVNDLAQRRKHFLPHVGYLPLAGREGGGLGLLVKHLLGPLELVHARFASAPLVLYDVGVLGRLGYLPGVVLDVAVR